MEAVSAVVEATVAAARVDTVTVRRIRRICLNPVAAENREGEQGDRDTGSQKQPQMCERMGPAPP
jgi:hypothetical protein